MEVDILEFRVPVENNKTLLVWNLQPQFPEAQIHEELHAIFSSFGPLYLLKVCPNAPLHPPGFYALVKFYSAAQASAAQRLTDGRPLFQSSPLKVRLSSKQAPHFVSEGSRLLSHARCLDLANHCLGFNGWTSDIVTLKELTSEDGGGEEEEEEEEEEEAGRRKRLRFGCLLQLSFPQHDRSTRAAAVVEDTFTCTAPDVLLQKRCQLLKRVREKALVQAFSTVLLILLGDGEVMVEVKETSEQLLPEPEGVLQVNEFSWGNFAAAEGEEEEEEELDLTVS